MKTTKTLLMLGTSLGSVDIIRKAQTLGCHVIVTDNLPSERSFAKGEADEYWMFNTADVDALEQRCREEGVDAVFAGVSEFNLDRVLELCERLELPCFFGRGAWSYARDKARFKEACLRAGVPVTREYAVDQACIDALIAGKAKDAVNGTVRSAVCDITGNAGNDMSELRFPVVVKPVDGCGNAGVSFCHNEKELIQAWQLVRELSDNPRVLVEEYVSGVECSTVYVLAEGHASMMSFRTSFSQPGLPTNLYVFGSTVASHVEEYMRDVDPAVRRMFKEVGCREGIAWVQAMRTTEGEYRVFEMGHRLSAEMGYDRAAEMGDFDVVKWVLESQLGINHEAAQLPAPQLHSLRRCIGVRLLFSARAAKVSKIVGSEKTARLAGAAPGQKPRMPGEGLFVELLVHPGDEVRQYQLMGRIAFSAQDCDGMLETLRAINQTLRILDEDDDDLILPFTNYDAVSAIYEEGLAQLS